jgi:hypothetical protein
MNQRLSNRLLELENSLAPPDKPIVYQWIEGGEDVQARCAETARRLPERKVVAVRWLDNPVTEARP